MRFGYGRDFFSLAQGIVLTVDMPATADEPVQVQGGIPFGDLAQGAGIHSFVGRTEIPVAQLEQFFDLSVARQAVHAAKSQQSSLWGIGVYFCEILRHCLFFPCVLCQK